jgi:hypothetical protein
VRFVARLLMRDFRWAIAVTGVTLICSIFLSILGVISAASVSFVTLREGGRVGFRLIAFSTLAVVLLDLLVLQLGDRHLDFLYLCAVLWFPALILGYVLRRSESQASALVVVAIIVGTYAGVFRFMVGDTQQFWYTQISPILTQLYDNQEIGIQDSTIQSIANQMHHVSVAMLFAFYSATILLARWWQSELFNFGGFGDEFKKIEMPRITVYIVALIGVLVVSQALIGSQSGLVMDIFIIFTLLFAFQGLSVVHFRARSIGLARGWMIAFYSLVLLLPQLSGLILATTGVADGFADFRRAKD